MNRAVNPLMNLQTGFWFYRQFSRPASGPRETKFPVCSSFFSTKNLPVCCWWASQPEGILKKGDTRIRAAATWTSRLYWSYRSPHTFFAYFGFALHFKSVRDVSESFNMKWLTEILQLSLFKNFLRWVVGIIMGFGHHSWKRGNKFLNLVKLDWVLHLSPLKKGVVPIACLM